MITNLKSSKPVAMVFGASRGIGAQIAITLSKQYHVILLSKSTINQPSKLPGTIEDVLQRLMEENGTGECIHCDVRKESTINHAIDQVVSKYGRIDAIIYNPGAIDWSKVKSTTVKKFDLMHEVNDRGLYLTVHHALPIFDEQKFGRFIVVSPPIYSRFFRGKTPYAMTKIAMSVLAVGLSMELGENQSISCLWPATAIKSQVTDNFKMDDKLLRDPSIFADACLEILNQPIEVVNGKCLIDEDFLKSTGVTNFEKYRCNPLVEPPRMLPKKFPSLLVEEQDDRGISITRSKL
ncbi:CG5590-like protein [Globomyces pollinis-pini]|nr:CG5590-like protein [Globomyces pollinis-pini]